MVPEPELIKAKLIEFGCPYPPGDERAIIWLDGYQRGMSDAMDTTIKKFKKFAGEKS